jgi:sugar O-acyltransferase (sialic acid O-acetyltransferase NeuD family)
MATELVIIGATNPETVRLIEQINEYKPTWHIIGFMDDDPAKANTFISGFPVLGPLELLATELRGVDVANNIASATAVRRKVVERLKDYGVVPVTLVHLSVDMRRVEIGEGTVIYEGNIISPCVTIGRHCIITFHNVIAHESRLGDFVAVAPGCVITGRIVLEEGVYIGAGATILPQVRIGAWSKVGAGSVVMKDVPARSTVWGNPARVLLQHDAADK